MNTTFIYLFFILPEKTPEFFHPIHLSYAFFLFSMICASLIEFIVHKKTNQKYKTVSIID